MSKSRKERTDIGGATAVEEPTVQEHGADSTNGAEPDPGREPALLPVNGAQNTEQAKPKRPEETKSQRFRRLANRRLAQAVKAIGRLSPLSNKAQYESGEEERTILLEVLRQAIMRVQSAFTDTKRDAPASYFR